MLLQFITTIYIILLSLYCIVVTAFQPCVTNDVFERFTICGDQRHQHSTICMMMNESDGMGKECIGIKSISRDRFISNLFSSAVIGASSMLFLNDESVAHALDTNDDMEFRSKGWGREEYTNSITASRDTNISPKEVYDSIQSSYLQYPLEQIKLSGRSRSPRVFDVGAGAGVATQVLWNMGYRDIVACDWSSTAWDENVEQCPSSVKFYEMDDESYVNKIWSKNSDLDDSKFDAIVFNFAINESKAKQAAKLLLDPKHGRLLAPVNTQSDYWQKQAFKVYDAEANILWSASDVGAWSVQFQPDVTQETCQGIWCPPYNGFKKPKS